MKERLPVELMEMAARLSEERPSLSPLEFDGHGSGSADGWRPRLRKDPFMRARLAIMLMLLLGVFLTAGGTGLALSAEPARPARTRRQGELR